MLQKEKLKNKGSAFIISIYSILIISMTMGIIILYTSNLSKRIYALEGVSRVAFDNWYYKVKKEGLKTSTLVINCGFETLVISDKKTYINAVSTYCRWFP